MKLFYRYFYGGNLTVDSNKIFDYLLISKELDISELLERLQDKLLLHLPNQIYQQFSTTLRISSTNGFKKLHEFCLETIRDDPETIFNSQDFHLLDEDTLLMLLQNEKLSLKEIEKWESIVKWGNYRTFADTSTSAENYNEMPDISLWTKIKFRDLANALVKFIPLINFNKISPEDFYEKVKPFKKVLGKQLYEETLRCHLLSKDERSNQEQLPTSTPTSISSSVPLQRKDEPKPITNFISRWLNNESSNCYGTKYVFILLSNSSLPRPQPLPVFNSKYKELKLNMKDP